MWVDSHCHVHGADDPDAQVERARQAGVGRLVCVGTDEATSRAALALAGRHPDVLATVGLHPHDANRFEEEWPALVAMAADPDCAGIGEAGFDLYYEHSPVEAQERAFAAQIELANDLRKALVIHSRDAWDLTFGVLRAVGVPERTVFHCFTGGPSEAQIALDLGCYVSFSGIVTFKNAQPLRDAAALVPDDRFLVETDAPYLAPEPYRGKPNEPAYVPLVGAGVAAARGVAAEVVEELTAANAAVVFGT